MLLSLECTVFINTTTVSRVSRVSRVLAPLYYVDFTEQRNAGYRQLIQCKYFNLLRNNK